MIKVKFMYCGEKTKINANKNEKLKKCIEKFFEKSNYNLKEKDLNFFYDKKKIDTKKTIEEIIDGTDLENEKIQIEVIKKGEKYQTPKYVICPEPNCGESISFRIKNYRINLFGCKNGHTKENYSFEKFEKKQLINTTKICCSKCKNTMRDIPNSEFYRCFNCKKYFCPECKYDHEREFDDHTTKKYEELGYYCEDHNENYIKFCEDCKLNLCSSCENQHNNHKVISFDNLVDADKVREKAEDIKRILDDFDKEIEKIVEKFNSVKDTIRKYYINLLEKISEEYNDGETNYQILNNINGLLEIDTKDLEEINKETNIKTQIKSIMEIYDKIFNYKEKSFKNAKYIGGFTDGNMEGKGKIVYNNGNIYEGEWKDGKANGKGVFQWSNGDKYEGEFVDGKIEGKGICYYHNGDKYEGEFKNDVKDGRGKFIYKNGDEYEGEFSNGKREGYGVFSFDNGNKYEGQYEDDKKEGKGIFTWTNGDRYEGEFKEGKRDGKGVYYYYDNGDMEIGEFSKGNDTGIHIIIHEDGSFEKKEFN